LYNINCMDDSDYDSDSGSDSYFGDYPHNIMMSDFVVLSDINSDVESDDEYNYIMMMRHNFCSSRVNHCTNRFSLFLDA